MAWQHHYIDMIKIQHHHYVDSATGTEIEAHNDNDKLSVWIMPDYGEMMDRFIKEHGKVGLAHVCSELDALKQALIDRFLPQNQELYEKKQLNRIQALEI